MKKMMGKRIREFYSMKAQDSFDFRQGWLLYLFRRMRRLNSFQRFFRRSASSVFAGEGKEAPSFKITLPRFSVARKEFFINRMGKIGVCLALFLVLQFSTAQNVAVTVEDPLGRAFQATGAELDKAYITGRADLTAQEDEAAAAGKIIEDIAARLNIPMKAAALEKQDSDYQKCLKLSFSDESRQTVISVIRRYEEQNKVSIIIHNMQKNPQYRDITAIKNNIYEILQSFNHSPLITTCLEGYLDGKLRKGEWEFCLRDSFAAIDARRISGMDNGIYMSCIGYSALLPEKIAVDSKDVNFNVAMRYHGFDNRTYVTVGSPLITVDY